MNLKLRLFEFCCSLYIGYYAGKVFGLDLQGIAMVIGLCWFMAYLVALAGADDDEV